NSPRSPKSKLFPYTTLFRSQNPTNITMEIHRYACQLFDSLWDGTPIRHLGIHTSRVRDGFNMRQMDMFDHTDYEKLEKMDATVEDRKSTRLNSSHVSISYAV